MKITVIYSSPRKPSTTTTMAKKLLLKFPEAEIKSFSLAELNIPYCKGCLACVKRGMEFCPHSDLILPIKEALIECDLIVLTSPVYVMHMSGQLKVFLDHTCSMFLIHRAEPSMFKKQAVIISAAAGPVTKGTVKEIKTVLNFWGISKIYSLQADIATNNWNKISNKKKKKITNKVDKIAKNINKNKEKRNPSFEVRKWFIISRKLNEKHTVSIKDQEFWAKQGWNKKIRPWKIK